MAKNIHLRTRNLDIREYHKDDIPEVHEFASDAETVKFMTWGPNTIDDTKVFVKLAIEQQSIDPRLNYHFAVIYRKSMKLIGGCGIHIDKFNLHTAILGYCFNKSFWGLGYATETAGELIRFGFEYLNLHRIIARCDTRNIASSKVLENNKMRKEAHLYENIWQRGEWRDSFQYAILHRERRGN